MGRPITLPEPQERMCTQCGRVFVPARKRARAIYCSIKCQRAGCLRGTEGNAELSRQTSRRRGDALRGTGKGDTYVKRDGRHEHRVVMEQVLGRPLLPGEIVHHKDHDKKNNSPDNLMLLGSQAAHCKGHSSKKRKCSVQGCERKHMAKGLCGMHYQRVYKKT